MHKDINDDNSVRRNKAKLEIDKKIRCAEFRIQEYKNNIALEELTIKQLRSLIS